MTVASADCSLFFHPLTTSASPRIMASKPIRATSAGSAFFALPNQVPSISARAKNSVSVAPGIRQFNAEVGQARLRVKPGNDTDNAKDTLSQHQGYVLEQTNMSDVA